MWLPFALQIEARGGPEVESLMDAFTSCPHTASVDAADGAGLQINVAAELIGYVEDLLPPDIQRAAHLRRASFLAGRLCGEVAMLKVSGNWKSIGREGAVPIWPAEFRGSITHTAESAYAIACRATEFRSVGIDSERSISDASTLEAVRRHCCTEFERRAWVHGISEREIATTIFSAKEALFKAIYLEANRFVDYSEVEIVWACFQEGRILLAPAESSDLRTWLKPTTAAVLWKDGVVHSTIVWQR